MLVVSERGESLSPKNAPPTMAPAVIPKLASITPATPMMTTPMVPIDPQDVPVSMEKMMGIRKASK